MSSRQPNKRQRPSSRTASTAPDSGRAQKKNKFSRRYRPDRTQTVQENGDNLPSNAHHNNNSSAAHDYDAESVYSDFDLVNDTIQEFLLVSSSDDSDDEGFLGLGSAFFCTMVPPTLLQQRRRQSKKPNSSTSSSSKTTSRLKARKKDEGEGAVAAVSSTVVTARAALLLPALQPTRMGVPVGPLSIVLDLDETLVYARQGPIFIRPYVPKLLDVCERLRCEIIVWTAGVPRYVNPILHAIAKACGRQQWFHHIISRHRRWYSKGADGNESCVKDLRLLQRPLDRLLMIENNPASVLLQPMHAILVEDYLQPNEGDESLNVLSDVITRVTAHMQRPHTSRPSASSRSGSRHASPERTSVASAGAAAAAELPINETQSVTSALDADENLTHVQLCVHANGSTGDSQVQCRALKYTPLASSTRSYGCLQPLE